jgi:hypothetical protein
LSYSAWVLIRNRTLLLGWAFAILFLYHGVRVRTALAAQPLAPLAKWGASHSGAELLSVHHV